MLNKQYLNTGNSSHSSIHSSA